MWRFLWVAAAVFAGLALSRDARSDFPEGPPSDPAWDRAEEAYPDGDFFGQSWKHYSQRSLYAPNLSHPGARTDVAWRMTTGRWDVPVAVLDSGCYWNQRDLVEKWWLNRGELPPPQVDASGARLSVGIEPLGEAWWPAGEGLPDYVEFNWRLEEMQVELPELMARLMSPDGPLADGWRTGPYAPCAAWEERHRNAVLESAQGRNPSPVRRPPAPGIALGEHDVNGDGRFNVRDYDADSRVYDANANGMLDPQDLILIFSDGVDGDANGYVDDICGWDFWERDNDAYDNTRFGHGNGGAIDAAAEGDNGIGAIGSCPDCSVVPLRVADSFIADAADVALALAWCADNGVRAMDSSLGTLNNVGAARQALDYCAEQGVVLAASFADENTIHHNFITAYDPGIATSAIGANNVNVDGVLPFTTFKAKNNCTNYGARLDVLIPAQYCSSEATATASGQFALLQSYGLDRVARGELDRPLSANEVKQVVLQSAEDVNPLPLPWRWPGGPGWDQVHGYGRIDVGAAMERIAQGRIPPEVDLRGPEWFVTVDPVRRALLPIEARLAAERAEHFRYDVRWGWGVYPHKWHMLHESGILTQPLEGVVAEFDLNQLRHRRVRGVPTGPNRFSLTIWIRAWDDRGTLGEDRVQIFVHHDPDLLEGFPVKLGSSGESAPLFFDLDGDERDEILLGTADGWVHAFRADGSELAGFPVRTRALPGCDPEDPRNHLAARAFESGAVPPVHAAITGAVSAGDLDGDGNRELVATDMDGWVHVWNAAGQRRAGWPVRTDPELSRDRSVTRIVDDGIYSSAVLVDLDGDRRREVLVAAMDGHLYAWHDDGRPMAGFPFPVFDSSEEVPTLSRIVATPAVGNLDDDDAVEIVVGTNEVYRNVGRLYAVELDGSWMPGWPVRPLGFYVDVLRVIGRGMPGSPVLADVTGDGRLEVVASSMMGRTYVYDARGNELSRTDMGRFGRLAESRDLPSMTHLNHPTVVDLDGDEDLDVVTGAVGFRWALSQGLAGLHIPKDFHLNVHDLRSGRFLPRFPRLLEDHTFSGNPVIADLDGDGSLEAIQGTGAYLVHAYDAQGTEPRGWPKSTGGWVLGAAAVGDVDGDEYLEVAAVTREGWLWAWHTDGPAPPEGAPWPTFHHDPARTGNLNEPRRCTAEIAGDQR